MKVWQQIWSTDQRVELGEYEARQLVRMRWVIACLLVLTAVVLAQSGRLPVTSYAPGVLALVTVIALLGTFLGDWLGKRWAHRVRRRDKEPQSG